jgi:hypothetical protein
MLRLILKAGLPLGCPAFSFSIGEKRLRVALTGNLPKKEAK